MTAGEAPAASDAPPSSSRAALILIAASVLVILIGLAPIVAGLVAAPTLAVLCRPMYQRLGRRLGPHFAALLVVAVVWMLLAIPGVWLSDAAARQLPNAVAELRQGALALRTLPGPLAGMNADTLAAHVGAKSAGWIATMLGPALGSIGRAILDLSVALLSLYFLLISNDSVWLAVRRRLPFSTEGSEELRRTFVDGTRGSLLGTLLSAALQGASIGVGLWFVGTSAPAFWGCVAGFTTLVPVVGNALVWIPAVVTLLIRRDFAAAVVMFVFGKIIPALLDRVTRTVIARRVGNIHPLVTLFGTLVGLRLLGPMGLLIGPPLLQCSLTLLRLYDREYGFPRVST